jgi:uncharacterized protein YfbU (UPF0304 family)
MYRLITPSYENLSDEDKQRVDNEAYPFNDNVRFQGFDGNNDPHYGITSYLVTHLQRFTEVPPDLNSHSSATIDQYRRMLRAFKPMTDPYPHNGLTAEQLIQILTAGLPPKQ